jgi:hypothetical protein
MDGYAMSAGLLGACSNSSTSRVIGRCRSPFQRCRCSRLRQDMSSLGARKGGTALMAGKNRPRAVRSDRGCQTRKQLMAWTKSRRLRSGSSWRPLARAADARRQRLGMPFVMGGVPPPARILKVSNVARPRHGTRRPRIAFDERDRVSAPLSAARAVVMRPSFQVRPARESRKMVAGSRPAALAPKPLR